MGAPSRTVRRPSVGDVVTIGYGQRSRQSGYATADKPGGRRSRTPEASGRQRAAWPRKRRHAAAAAGNSPALSPSRSPSSARRDRPGRAARSGAARARPTPEGPPRPRPASTPPGRSRRGCDSPSAGSRAAATACEGAHGPTPTRGVTSRAARRPPTGRHGPAAPAPPPLRPWIAVTTPRHDA